MRYVLLISIAGAMALALAPGKAAAASIKDCEKIKAADAYNQCLASFGPVAHEHELKPVPAGVGSGKLHGRHHHRYSAHSGHSRGGRKTMQISVGPGNVQD